MRSEQDIVTMAPVIATFGTEKYEIKPLTVFAQGQWRDKMVDIMTPIMESFTAEASATSFAKAYGTALREAPEMFVGLVAEYGLLDKDTVAKAATPEQVAQAFLGIMEVAFPFGKPLETVTRLTATKKSQ